MKNVYAIFIALFTLIGFKATAQCNPEFNFQFLSASTVKMNPAIVTDSPMVQHYWIFGDGAPSVSQISPSHTYAAGTYNVKHYVIRHNPNGVQVCIDSLTRVLTIAQSCNLTAAFTSQPSTANPLSILFTNTSTGFTTGDSIKWTFGDGTFSYDLNPTHTYANGGTYTVCLRVKKNATSPTVLPCVSEICHTITVTAPNPCNYQAYYTYQAVTGQPNVIVFTNQTPGYLSTDSITWTFGDGTSSHDVNPTHIFTSNGLYHVCIIIKRIVPGAAPCIREFCRDIAITVPCTLQAAFTTQPVASSPMVIHFTNTSTGFATGDSIRWSFGDGTFSYDVNPTHTYANAGVYNVCLRVKKNNSNAITPACVSEICHTVTISAPCNLVVSWTSTAAAGQPNVIQFNNTSTGYVAGDSIKWIFGDGTTSSSPNPVHTYTTAGTYQVCLIIRKTLTPGTAPCVNESCHTVTVTLPCALNAAFTSQVSTANPLSVLFTNTLTGFATGDSIKWTFGDGTVSYDLNPTHTYANAGTYTVCLRVKKNISNTTASCVSEICHTVTVIAPCNIQAYYTYLADAAQPNLIHFTNQTGGFLPTDSVTWTFGDGTISHDVNPNHLYTTGGTYHVCVLIKRTTIAGTTPCIREYCRDIAVTVPVPYNLTASFTWYRDSSAVSLYTYHFNNTSVVLSSTDSIRWTFGDGTSSNAANPNHVYAQPGTYNVCLRVQKRNSNGVLTNCVSEVCHTVTVIQQVPCIRLSNFHTYPVTTITGANVFVPNVIFNDVQYTWTFGDGTGSHDVTATHTYAQPGAYTVCLTAYRNNSCASTTCMTVQVNNCSYYSLSITDQRDSLNPNKIKFTAVSNGAITDQLWTITKIPATATGSPVTIHANNPTYIFADSGYYNVCVRVTYANGCVREICKTIHILQNLPGTSPCTLQVFPNPASTTINAAIILTQPLLISGYVYNSANVLVAQKQQQGVTGNNTMSINIESLTPGVYVLRVVYGNSVCYATFIKQ